MRHEFETTTNDDGQQAQPWTHIAVAREWLIPDQRRHVDAGPCLAQARFRDCSRTLFDMHAPPCSGTDKQNRLCVERIPSAQAARVGKMAGVPDMVSEIIKALQSTSDRSLAMKEENNA